jgi:hypothetical protein
VRNPAGCRPALVQRVADTAAPIEQHRTRRAIDARADWGAHPAADMYGGPQPSGPREEAHGLIDGHPTAHHYRLPCQSRL